MLYLKLFENFIDRNDEVVKYLYKKLNDDKKEYKGDIKTQYNPGSPWNDKSWLVDEIIQFLGQNYRTSYTLLKFGDKYSFDVLDSILRNNFKTEYEEAKELSE